MYAFDSRVRYSETGEDGRLSLQGVMNYLQDCSTFQSEDLHLGVDVLRERKSAWWVQSWRLELGKMPRLGDRITIGTWAYDFRGFYGYRNFVVLDEEKKYLVKADSVWFHYNLEQKRPQRPEHSMVEQYLQEHCPRLEMGPIERKIAIGPGGEPGERIPVEKSHLDSNHHVNNAVYISMARDALKRELPIRSLEVWYKKAAVLGDVIFPRIVKTQGGYDVSLEDGRGEGFAALRFGLKNRGKEPQDPLEVKEEI